MKNFNFLRETPKQVQCYYITLSHLFIDSRSSPCSEKSLPKSTGTRFLKIGYHFAGRCYYKEDRMRKERICKLLYLFSLFYLHSFLLDELHNLFPIRHTDDALFPTNLQLHHENSYQKIDYTLYGIFSFFSVLSQVFLLDTVKGGY